MRTLSKAELAYASAGNITAAPIQAHDSKAWNIAIGALAGVLFGQFVLGTKFIGTVFFAFAGAAIWSLEDDKK